MQLFVHNHKQVELVLLASTSVTAGKPFLVGYIRHTLVFILDFIFCFASLYIFEKIYVFLYLKFEMTPLKNEPV